ncbi:hypothetical protein [Sporosarcina sp. ANT_H38]|nr:hypothetical protein [Sporosarcina sp. ANT_H38]
MEENYQNTYFYTVFEIQKGFNIGYSLQSTYVKKATTGLIEAVGS